MEVGERIRMFREKAGLSQNALAEKALISQTHLRRVELGSADITVGHLRLVCDALGISLNEFFADIDESKELAILLSKLTPKQKKHLLDFIRSL